MPISLHAAKPLAPRPRAVDTATRWLLSLCAAAALMALLFGWLLRLSAHPQEGLGGRTIEQVQVVDVRKPPPPPDTTTPPPPPPPPPPAAPQPPAPNAAAAAPAAALSAPAISTLAVGNIAVPAGKGGSGTDLGFGGMSLGGSGTFGGFAGGGGNGAGFGAAEGFKGKDLVPLSTARPQIPEWAYKRGIEGWVEVVFVVGPNGRVGNVRIVNAQPKGVFEAAAIESISNWIYQPNGKTSEVFQRVEFKLEDFQYNWKQ